MMGYNQVIILHSPLSDKHQIYTYETLAHCSVVLHYTQSVAQIALKQSTLWVTSCLPKTTTTMIKPAKNNYICLNNHWLMSRASQT